MVGLGVKELNSYMVKVPSVLSYLVWSIDLPNKLSFESSELARWQIWLIYIYIYIYGNRDSLKGSRVPKEISWALGRTMGIRILGENGTTTPEHRIEKKYEGIPEEVRNKFELVHLPSRIAS